eukprot:scpid103084/ scgid27773/ 
MALSLSLARRSLATGLKNTLRVRSATSSVTEAARDLNAGKVPTYVSAYKHGRVPEKNDCLAFREQAQIEMDLVKAHGLHEASPYKGFQNFYWSVFAGCVFMYIVWSVWFMKEMRTDYLTELHKKQLNAKARGEF